MKLTNLAILTGALAILIISSAVIGEHGDGSLILSIAAAFLWLSGPLAAMGLFYEDSKDKNHSQSNK